MPDIRTNWAGNYIFNASEVYFPETVEEVQEFVSRSKKLRVLGSGHSFNAIADTFDVQISLSNLKNVWEIDREKHTLTIDGGMTYGKLCERLQNEGYALHNLASLPHISVVGACATATHGSGNQNGNLATIVSAMELVTADGTIKRVSRQQDADEFQGLVVGLGGFGVVTKLTLDIVPTYEMKQYVYEGLPLAQLEKHFEEVESRAYSVSLFTDWQSEKVTQVWLKQRVEDKATAEIEPTLFGANLAKTNHHPISGISAENCTEQLGVPGHWYERLPHFRIGFMPSSGEEIQTEYLIPRQHAVEAIRAVESLKDKIGPLLLVSEVRTIAADNLWLSPCYQQPCIGIHFTWIKDWKAISEILPLIEEKLRPFKALPHWGKVFTFPADYIQAGYPKLRDFQKLMRSYDPQGKFRNGFLDTYIFGEE